MRPRQAILVMVASYARRMRSLPVFIALAVLAVACGTAQRTGTRHPGATGPLADAPHEPANDRDLDDMRDQYLALDVGANGRAALRRALAEEYGRRMVEALERDDTAYQAHERLLDLLGLWRASELAGGADLASELAPYVPTVRTLRARAARAGLDVEAVAALYFLSLADPGRRADYLSEVDEIFGYADALARAEYGDGAETSRPIAILEALVEEAPMPATVDRLIELYITRQEIFMRLFQNPDRRMELIRAHGGGVLDTGWHIVRVLARANRLSEAPRQLARFQGMGQNQRLGDALDGALAANASDAAWLELARLYLEASGKEDEERKQARLRAALALCHTAAERLPESARLAACAGQAARELDLLHVAIRYFEAAVARDDGDRDAANHLAELYRIRVSTLAFYERPLAAAKRLEELETFLARSRKKWPKKPLDTDLADAYTAMGRGMTSLGELARATEYLERSLALRPSAGALEQLGTIALKQDRVDQAVKYYERALALPANEVLDEYHRARILRLAGDAWAAAGNAERAAERWKKSLLAWMALDSQYDLPTAYKGELLVESGKAQWALGDSETALTAFEVAVDVDADGADTYSSVVSFLIVRGQYRRALDAYHRALGSHAISPYSKVYMSLWVLAEARRTGRRADPLALEYLASRRGRLWHDQLARFATGREQLAALEGRAATRGQRAELLYYGAVLDDRRESAAVREAMQHVVDTGMVLFYEYDMAKYWLSEGFARQSGGTRAGAGRED